MKRFGVLCILILLAACSGQQPAPPGMKIGKPYVIDGKTYYPEYDAAYDKTGTASWYGPGFHGKYTANGEVFNQNDLTAAHPTLPMPSLVRVTNLENGKSVVVRVNDRGPFKSNRIIDLSKKSAQTLGIHSLAQVRVQFLKSETEQYIAQRQGSRGDIDMFAYNAQTEQRKNNVMLQSTEPETADIVESTVASSQSGQSVNDAAPVMSVDSDDIGRQSIQVSDTAPIEKPANASKSAGLIKEALADDKVRTVPLSKVRVNANETITEEVETAYNESPEPGAVTLSSPKRASIKTEQSTTVSPKSLSPSSGGKAGYFIQAGSFAAEENAHKLSDRLAGLSRANIDQIELNGRSWWRVRLGPFYDQASAEDTLQQVRANGVPDARIVHQ